MQIPVKQMKIIWRVCMFCVVVCGAVRLSGKRSDTEIFLMFGRCGLVQCPWAVPGRKLCPGSGGYNILWLGEWRDNYHVGIVESVTNGVVNTIEGNSGDKVARRSYNMGSDSIYGYGVVAYWNQAKGKCTVISAAFPLPIHIFLFRCKYFLTGFRITIWISLIFSIHKTGTLLAWVHFL